MADDSLRAIYSSIGDLRSSADASSARPSLTERPSGQTVVQNVMLDSSEINQAIQSFVATAKRSAAVEARASQLQSDTGSLAEYKVSELSRRQQTWLQTARKKLREMMWEETDKQLNATKVLIASESTNVLDAARRACESQLSTWIDTVQAQMRADTISALKDLLSVFEDDARQCLHTEAKDWEAQRRSALERCRADLASQRESQLTAIRKSNQESLNAEIQEMQRQAADELEEAVEALEAAAKASRAAELEATRKQLDHEHNLALREAKATLDEAATDAMQNLQASSLQQHRTRLNEMAHKALQQSEALIQQRREELEQRYREKERDARRELHDAMKAAQDAAERMARKELIQRGEQTIQELQQSLTREREVRLEEARQEELQAIEARADEVRHEEHLQTTAAVEALRQRFAEERAKRVSEVTRSMEEQRRNAVSQQAAQLQQEMHSAVETLRNSLAREQEVELQALTRSHHARLESELKRWATEMRSDAAEKMQNQKRIWTAKLAALRADLNALMDTSAAAQGDSDDESMDYSKTAASAIVQGRGRIVDPDMPAEAPRIGVNTQPAELQRIARLLSHQYGALHQQYADTYDKLVRGAQQIIRLRRMLHAAESKAELAAQANNDRIRTLYLTNQRLLEQQRALQDHEYTTVAQGAIHGLLPQQQTTNSGQAFNALLPMDRNSRQPASVHSNLQQHRDTSQYYESQGAGVMHASRNAGGGGLVSAAAEQSVEVLHSWIEGRAKNESRRQYGRRTAPSQSNGANRSRSQPAPRDVSRRMFRGSGGELLQAPLSAGVQRLLSQPNSQAGTLSFGSRASSVRSHISDSAGFPTGPPHKALRHGMPTDNNHGLLVGSAYSAPSSGRSSVDGSSTSARFSSHPPSQPVQHRPSTTDRPQQTGSSHASSPANGAHGIGYMSRRTATDVHADTAVAFTTPDDADRAASVADRLTEDILRQFGHRSRVGDEDQHSQSPTDDEGEEFHGVAHRAINTTTLHGQDDRGTRGSRNRSRSRSHSVSRSPSPAGSAPTHRTDEEDGYNFRLQDISHDVYTAKATDSPQQNATTTRRGHGRAFRTEGQRSTQPLAGISGHSSHAERQAQSQVHSHVQDRLGMAQLSPRSVDSARQATVHAVDKVTPGRQTALNNSHLTAATQKSPASGPMDRSDRAEPHRPRGRDTSAGAMTPGRASFGNLSSIGSGSTQLHPVGNGHTRHNSLSKEESLHTQRKSAILMRPARPPPPIQSSEPVRRSPASSRDASPNRSSAPHSRRTSPSQTSAESQRDVRASASSVGQPDEQQDSSAADIIRAAVEQLRLSGQRLHGAPATRQAEQT